MLNYDICDQQNIDGAKTNYKAPSYSRYFHHSSLKGYGVINERYPRPDSSNQQVSTEYLGKKEWSGKTAENQDDTQDSGANDSTAQGSSDFILGSKELIPWKLKKHI